ncbi:MAG: crossover junction endodeoxyribonuclease RuvC [Methylococcales bacterium]|nr:crossover junction endodeoxyribonuclease RuvC [Methylococcales bacterium]MBT7411167.1 crossover junction endodeoxyribonuclease RuvC [Methylococcales bacterium]
MGRILGVDPGSRVTGYGIIDEVSFNKINYVTSGCIKLPKCGLPQRLKIIFEQLSDIVKRYQPDEFSIETVFVHKNVDSALKLGQARGAAICAGVQYDLPVAEYTPREIKKSIVGNGNADKQQVQYMVKVLLNQKQEMLLDESDALAIALCHANTSRLSAKLN